MWSGKCIVLFSFLKINSFIYLLIQGGYAQSRLAKTATCFSFLEHQFSCALRRSKECLLLLPRCVCSVDLVACAAAVPLHAWRQHEDGRLLAVHAARLQAVMSLSDRAVLPVRVVGDPDGGQTRQIWSEATQKFVPPVSITRLNLTAWSEWRRAKGA